MLGITDNLVGVDLEQSSLPSLLIGAMDAALSGADPFPGLIEAILFLILRPARQLDYVPIFKLRQM